MWKPKKYDKDPTVNALLNIADGLHRIASATDRLLYGLKYSHDNGMSIAEAIEEGSSNIASGLTEVASSVGGLGLE